jgi:hypothetical protein
LYPDTGRLSRYIKPLAEQMSSEKEISELKQLFSTKEKVFDKATQGVKQSLETVIVNNQWKTTMYNDFQRRLNRMLLRNFDYNDIDDDEEDLGKSSSDLEATTIST